MTTTPETSLEQVIKFQNKVRQRVHVVDQHISFLSFPKPFFIQSMQIIIMEILTKTLKLLNGLKCIQFFIFVDGFLLLFAK